MKSSKVSHEGQWCPLLRGSRPGRGQPGEEVSSVLDTLLLRGS